MYEAGEIVRSISKTLGHSCTFNFFSLFVNSLLHWRGKLDRTCEAEVPVYLLVCSP